MVSFCGYGSRKTKTIKTTIFFIYLFDFRDDGNSLPHFFFGEKSPYLFQMINSQTFGSHVQLGLAFFLLFLLSIYIPACSVDAWMSLMVGNQNWQAEREEIEIIATVTLVFDLKAAGVPRQELAARLWRQVDTPFDCRVPVLEISSRAARRWVASRPQFASR